MTPAWTSMPRHWAAACMILCALMGPVASAAAEDSKTERAASDSEARKDSRGIYAMSMAQAESGMRIVEYWSRGSSFRAHTTLAGHPLVTIVNGDYYATLDPVYRRGIKVKRSDRALKADGSRGRAFGNEYDEVVAAGGEKIRTDDTPAGSLDVFQVTDQLGRRTVWVTTDEYRLPLRYETFGRKNGHSARLDYINWEPVNLLPEFFEIPVDGWKIDVAETYEEFVRAERAASIRRAPVIFPLLLHGTP